MKTILTAVILVTAISSGVDAQTNVSGGIYTNTTWTLINSPYIVTDTTVVFPNVILTIEPGVVVKFENNKYMEFRQASLIALGTAIDSITFTSNSSSPIAGIYTGIYLNGGSHTSAFNHCKFNYASIGIQATLWDSLSVNNSYFEQNVIGLQFIGNAGTQVALVDSSIFNNNTYGLELGELSYAEVKYCNFTHDTLAGLAMWTNASGLFYSNTSYCNFSNDGTAFTFNTFNIYLNHCNFYHNYIGVRGPGALHYYKTYNFTMLNCNIDSNQSGALYLGYMFIDSCTFNHNTTGYSIGNGANGRNRIINCAFDSNSVIGLLSDHDSIVNCSINYNGTGIQIGSYSQIHGCSIEHNTLKNIQGSGFITGCTIRYSYFGVDDSIGTSGVTLTNNIIENNNVGIRLNNPYNHISCNKICNNTIYDLQYGATANMDASNNYWCTADSASTEAVIYDGYDNILYGLVSIIPIDTVQCFLSTGIPVHEGQIFSFKIYPNPSSDYLTIELPSSLTKTEIKFFNVIGELEYSSSTSKQKTNLDISTLKNGLHIIEISSGGKIGRRKFIKQ